MWYIYFTSSCGCPDCLINSNDYFIKLFDLVEMYSDEILNKDFISIQYEEE